MITGITTLLRWREWEEAMAGHPDRRFREYIALGIHQGFRIGFDRRSGVAPRSCRQNIHSAYEHPEVVSDYLARECKAARVLGPVSCVAGVAAPGHGYVGYRPAITSHTTISV